MQKRGYSHLDIHGSLVAFAVAFGIFCASPRALSEVITLQGPNVVASDSTFFVIARLSNNDDPLVAYSLDLIAQPQSGAIGSMVGNASSSNFLAPFNVISQGGGQLDPLLSFIVDTIGDGVFFNAVNEGFEPVMPAAPGVNDGLALAAFDVSPGASGNFTIRLGIASVLVGETFTPVPFETRTLTVFVPEPGTLALVAMGLVALHLPRHRNRVKNHR